MNARDAFLFRLQETPGLGPAGLARVLSRSGAPDAAFFGRDPAWYRAEYGLPERAAAFLACPSPPPAFALCPTWPVRAVIAPDGEYPANLHRWPGAPALLWTPEGLAYGLTNGSICILASSSGPQEESEFVREALQAAVDAGLTLVAGHNRPLYVRALLAAKRCGTPSVMALDRGLFEAFEGDFDRDPVAPARIWGYSFDRGRCRALSPFRLRDGWVAANGRLRDALVVGLSDIVVTAGIRPGGTMHRLCLKALAQGRLVYASPGDLSLLAGSGARRWSGRFEP